MQFEITIWDMDKTDLYWYQFQDRYKTLGHILESLTVDGRKINYKNRYIYINNNGEVGTPLNDLDKNLMEYNLLHDDTESVTLIISNTPNLLESTLQEKVNLAFKLAHLKESQTKEAPVANKKAWLKEAWPELEKPPIMNLAKQKYMERTGGDLNSASIY